MPPLDDDAISATDRPSAGHKVRPETAGTGSATRRGGFDVVTPAIVRHGAHGYPHLCNLSVDERTHFMLKVVQYRGRPGRRFLGFGFDSVFLALRGPACAAFRLIPFRLSALAMAAGDAPNRSERLSKGRASPSTRSVPATTSACRYASFMSPSGSYRNPMVAACFSRRPGVAFGA